MATIYNTDLTKELKDGAKIQQIRDVIPSQLAEKVVPVMEVNPKLLRRCNIARSDVAINATAQTIYTAPTDKDFYLCGASCAVIKDATATSTNTAVVCSPAEGGNTANVISIAGLTLTAQENCNSIMFSPPLLIKRGTAIQVTNSTNVGNVTGRGFIYGYTVDNVTA